MPPPFARPLVVVPARLGASRLPGKPLRDLGGRPLVVRTWARVRAALPEADLVVATDDGGVAEAVRAAGGVAELTSRSCRSGTDRAAEVLARRRDIDAVLNVQGDEPFIEAATLRAVLDAMADDGDCWMATAACPFPPDRDPLDPGAVKVVVDGRGRALYFSRAPIPHWDGIGARPDFRLHLGVYAYRPEWLRAFASLPQSPLEVREGLEQLRALEAGAVVRVVPVSAPRYGGIDTEEDLAAAREVLALHPGEIEG